MPRLRVSIDTGFAGCTHVTDLDEEIEGWESMTPEERETVLQEYVQDSIDDHIDAWVEVLDDQKGG